MGILSLKCYLYHHPHLKVPQVALGIIEPGEGPRSWLGPASWDLGTGKADHSQISFGPLNRGLFLIAPHSQIPVLIWARMCADLINHIETPFLSPLPTQTHQFLSWPSIQDMPCRAIDPLSVKLGLSEFGLNCNVGKSVNNILRSLVQANLNPAFIGACPMKLWKESLFPLR